LVPV
jgi:hypothetical protein